MYRKYQREKPTCLWCGCELDNQGDVLSTFINKDCLCFKCRSLMKARVLNYKVNNVKVTSFYPYKDIGREMLLQYKEYYDEALYPIFLYPYLKWIEHRYSGYVLVPIPSSYINEFNRGFKQVIQMFSNISLDIYDCLEKKDEVENKKLSKKQREIATRNITLKNTDIPNKPILIIDDVLTTGYTITQAYNCLRPYTNRTIKALCVFGHETYYKNPLLTEIREKFSKIFRK